MSPQTGPVTAERGTTGCSSTLAAWPQSTQELLAQPSHRQTQQKHGNALLAWEPNGTGFICTSVTSKGPLFEFFCL